VLVGGDGHARLAALWAPDAPAWLRTIPAVETLRRVWVQQFRLEGGTLRWRAADDIPPAAVSSGSPYDDDAHDARKSTTTVRSKYPTGFRGAVARFFHQETTGLSTPRCTTPWVGYTIHVTETCDDNAPRLITHVETTSAPVGDAAALPAVHQALRGRELLPAVQLVDSGSLDAPQIVAAHDDHAIALRGPARPDYHWQARARNGFALDDFRLDWAREQATCPTGRTSSSWRQRPDPAGRPLLWVTFSSKDCGPCPSRSACCNTRAVEAEAGATNVRSAIGVLYRAITSHTDPADTHRGPEAWRARLMYARADRVIAGAMREHVAGITADLLGAGMSHAER